MSNNSAFYGLSNPAFHDDIGMTSINRMFPSVIDPITGLPEMNYLDGARLINNGQPQKDSYSPTKREQEEKTIKTILFSAALTALGIFGLYKCKGPFNSCKTFIKNGYNKAISAGAALWTKVKALPAKIKSFF